MEKEADVGCTFVLDVVANDSGCVSAFLGRKILTGHFYYKWLIYKANQTVQVTATMVGALTMMPVLTLNC